VSSAAPAQHQQQQQRRELSPEDVIPRVPPGPRKIRILVAKPGLDGHDRGALVLARAFRDSGMEVIYSGLLPTPEQVAQMAVDEDVDVVALSLLNGAHMTAFPKVVKFLTEKGGKDIVVVGGGIIPDADKPKLERLGISGNFGPGTSLREIIEHIVARVQRERWGVSREASPSGAAAGGRELAKNKKKPSTKARRKVHRRAPVGK
jgi:methylmalonyl-CoA mutase C-terminal domain/subunit